MHVYTSSQFQFQQAKTGQLLQLLGGKVVGVPEGFNEIEILGAQEKVMERKAQIGVDLLTE